MESVSKEVKDLQADERAMIERWLGRPLDPIQRITLSLVPKVPADLTQSRASAEGIPPSWKVLEGISPAELEQLESLLSERANLTRYDQGQFDSMPERP